MSGHINMEIKNALLYTVADKSHYEPLDRLAVVFDYKSLLEKKLPEDWLIKEKGIWYHCMPQRHRLPLCGFKLHISTAACTAEKLLSLVADVCYAERVGFKVVSNANLLAVVNSKFFPRAAGAQIYYHLSYNNETLYQAGKGAGSANPAILQAPIYFQIGL